MRLILASASPRRLDLLAQLGVIPEQVIAPDLDEQPLRHELPAACAVRLASSKAAKIAAQYPQDLVLAADTVVACGRRMIEKPNDAEGAVQALRLLSGRRHRVYSAITLQRGAQEWSELAVAMVQFQRLSAADLAWLAPEGIGVAGGYRLQGRAGAYVKFMRGHPSTVIGLPLPETYRLLQRAGWQRP